MKNFWHVVRMALRYRMRYALAVAAAMAGAVLFGGNIAAALPLLKVLLKDQTLHEYVTQRIDEQQAEVDKLQKRLAKFDGAIDQVPGAPDVAGGANRRSLELSLQAASRN